MQINYKSHSLAIPKVHSLQYPGCQRVFFSCCWQRKLSGEIFAANVSFLRHAFETVVHLRSWTFLIRYIYLFLFLSSFCLLISGLVPEVLAWLLSFKEELRSIISVCHLPERPLPSPDRPILFFLGTLSIFHCRETRPLRFSNLRQDRIRSFSLACEKHF